MIGDNQHKLAACKGRLRKRLGKIIRDCDELIQLFEDWNTNRPSETPFDAGAQRVLRKQAQDMLALVENNECIAPADYERMLEQAELLVEAGK